MNLQYFDFGMMKFSSKMLEFGKQKHVSRKGTKCEMKSWKKSRKKRGGSYAKERQHVMGRNEEANKWRP